jgi:hypothetical protein
LASGKAGKAVEPQYVQGYAFVAPSILISNKLHPKSSNQKSMAFENAQAQRNEKKHCPDNAGRRQKSCRHFSLLDSIASRRGRLSHRAHGWASSPSLPQ